MRWILLFAFASAFAEASSSSSGASVSSGSSGSTLCAASCCTAHSASGSGSSGHHQWWTHDHEYYHLQECFVIVLVVLTLCFDIVHHIIEHAADHTNDYFDALMLGHKHVALHELRVTKVDHRSLFALLFRRMTGELTVLGFLAFVVWCCNQSGFFDRVHEAFAHTTDISLPGDGLTYLHMAEAVHMQLFIAMLTYFALLGCSIYFAKSYMQLWHDCSDEIRSGFRNGSIKAGEIEDWAQSRCARTQRFARLRTAFLSGLQAWKGRWPFFDETLGQLVDHYTPEKENSLKNYMEPFFPVGQYVAMNYRYILDDMVEIQPQTWVAIVLTRIIQALVHRAKFNVHFSIFWMVVGILCTGVCYAWCTYRLRRLQSRNFKHEAVLAHPIFHRLTPALMACRIFQICLFGVCFGTSTTFADAHAWHTDYVQPLILIVLVVLGIVPFGRLLGLVLARLAVTSACGSFITERNILRIAVIVEEHAQGLDKLVREAGDDVEAFDKAAEMLEKKIATGEFSERCGQDVASEKL